MSKDVKKVLTAVDRSTKQLESAEANFRKVIDSTAKDVSELTKQVIDLATDIEFKQSELDNLGEVYKVQEREAKADLALRIRENEVVVLDQMLKQGGLVKVTKEAWSQLEAENAKLKDEFEAKAEEVKQIATLEANQRFQTKLNEIDSAHKVEVAELKASSNADQFKIQTLEDTVEQLRSSLDEERKARVEIAQSEAKRQGVVVNTGK